MRASWTAVCTKTAVRLRAAGSARARHAGAARRGLRHTALARVACKLSQTVRAALWSDSLFQTTARRFDGPGFASPLVITAEEFRFIVADQLAEAGVAAQAVMLEPEARSTGPAALAAALMLSLTEPEALILLAPTDHMIADPAAFRDAVDRGTLPRATDGSSLSNPANPCRDRLWLA